MQLLKALEEKKTLKKTLAAELQENEACDPEKLTEIRAYMLSTLNRPQTLEAWPLLMYAMFVLFCSRPADSSCRRGSKQMDWWVRPSPRCVCSCSSVYSPAENVFAMKSWCKNKFGVEESQIDKQFGIPEDFDYI